MQNGEKCAVGSSQTRLYDFGRRRYNRLRMQKTAGNGCNLWMDPRAAQGQIRKWADLSDFLAKWNFARARESSAFLSRAQMIKIGKPYILLVFLPIAVLEKPQHHQPAGIKLMFRSLHSFVCSLHGSHTACRANINICLGFLSNFQRTNMWDGMDFSEAVGVLKCGDAMQTHFFACFFFLGPNKSEKRHNSSEAVSNGIAKLDGKRIEMCSKRYSDALAQQICRFRSVPDHCGRTYSRKKNIIWQYAYWWSDREAMPAHK